MNSLKLDHLIERPQNNHDNNEPNNNNHGSYLEQDSSSIKLKRPYPMKVFFIIANEFCERFSFYGLRAILVLYLKDVLGFTDSQSTVSFHMFAALCYMTPILGATLADSVLGKFRTILSLSMIYLLGEFILVLSSILWATPLYANWLTLAGLVLIGLGTGGIKPCVSAFGGDQFLEHEGKRRATFFSIFYASINAGALLSMIVTPMVRSEVRCVNRLDCYPLAFGVPFALMLISIVFFLMAKNRYTRTPLPQENVILAFIQCVCLALKRRLMLAIGGDGANGPARQQSDNNEMATPIKGPLASSISSGVGCVKQASITSTSSMRTTSSSDSSLSSDQAAVAQTGIKANNQQHRHWIYLASDRFEPNTLQEFRSVLAILTLFMGIPIYWSLFDQQASLWTLQASRMDGRLPGTQFHVQPDQMGVANPVLLLASIALFECFLYPLFGKRLAKPLHRMALGGLLAALSFAMSAAIQLHIQHQSPPSAPPSGIASFQLVNGLADCRLVDLQLVHLNATTKADITTSFPTPFNSTSSRDYSSWSSSSTEWDARIANGTIALDPLTTRRVLVRSRALPPGDPTLVGYKIRFRVEANQIGAQATSNVKCPIASADLWHEINLNSLDDQIAMRLLYIQQGNGKLHSKLFEDSWTLPEPNKARAQIIYEAFGSLTQVEKRQFHLVAGSPHLSASSTQNSIERDNNTMRIGTRHHQQLQRYPLEIMRSSGQVVVFHPVDIQVVPQGNQFHVISSFSSSQTSSRQSVPLLNNLQLEFLNEIHLKPGTKNLILIHQENATNCLVKQNIVQDNTYRISIFWQLLPYLMISLSEVLFSITGLEFSYSMAPESMKSVILAAWALTTTFGNLLTVAIEALHLFNDLAHDFLFYAVLMLGDMILFHWLGRNFRNSTRASSHEIQVPSSTGSTLTMISHPMSSSTSDHIIQPEPKLDSSKQNRSQKQIL